MTGKRQSPAHKTQRPLSASRVARYGDLRLLGISVAILLLCLIGVILQKTNDEPIPATAPLDTSSVTSQTDFPSGTLSDTVSLSETGTNTPDYSDGNSQEIPADANSRTTPSPQEQKELLQDMAERIPPGQTIIF
ncbi:MAG: hypothetical protein Kow0099_10560 [Candidatus Abyssubacteria bacterium]